MKRKIIPYNTNLKLLARKLRNDSTPGEIILWKELRDKRFHGYDFHRQKSLLNHIVDFYCYELQLVIELDGRYHSEDDRLAKDCIRDNELAMYGLTVIRFAENETMNDIFNVMRTLESYVYQFSKKPGQDIN